MGTDKNGQQQQQATTSSVTRHQRVSREFKESSSDSPPGFLELKSLLVQTKIYDGISHSLESFKLGQITGKRLMKVADAYVRDVAMAEVKSRLEEFVARVEERASPVVVVEVLNNDDDDQPEGGSFSGQDYGPSYEEICECIKKDADDESSLQLPPLVKKKPSELEKLMKLVNAQEEINFLNCEKYGTSYYDISSLSLSSTSSTSSSSSSSYQFKSRHQTDLNKEVCSL
jgi:hypothetical protein